jgi:hypothetical protein
VGHRRRPLQPAEEGAVAKEASPLHLREGARAEEGLLGEQGRCQQDDHVGRLKMTRCGSHMSYG